MIFVRFWERIFVFWPVLVHAFLSFLLFSIFCEANILCDFLYIQRVFVMMSMGCKCCCLGTPGGLTLPSLAYVFTSFVYGLRPVNCRFCTLSGVFDFRIIGCGWLLYNLLILSNFADYFCSFFYFFSTFRAFLGINVISIFNQACFKYVISHFQVQLIFFNSEDLFLSWFRVIYVPTLRL